MNKPRAVQQFCPRLFRRLLDLPVLCASIFFFALFIIIIFLILFVWKFTLFFSVVQHDVICKYQFISFDVLSSCVYSFSSNLTDLPVLVVSRIFVLLNILVTLAERPIKEGRDLPSFPQGTQEPQEEGSRKGQEGCRCRRQEERLKRDARLLCQINTTRVNVSPQGCCNPRRGGGGSRTPVVVGRFCFFVWGIDVQAKSDGDEETKVTGRVFNSADPRRKRQTRAAWPCRRSS